MSLSYNERVLLPYFKLLHHNKIKNTSMVTPDKLISRSINVVIDFINPYHSSYNFEGIDYKTPLNKRGRINTDFENISSDLIYELIKDTNNFALVIGKEGSCPDSVQFFVDELPNGQKVLNCIVHQYFNMGLGVLIKDILYYSTFYRSMASELGKLFKLPPDYAGLNFHIGSLEVYKRDELLLEQLARLKA